MLLMRFPDFLPFIVKFNLYFVLFKQKKRKRKTGPVDSLVVARLR